MKKRILAAVLTLAMMFSLAVSASAANNVIRTEDVKISVDGKAIEGNVLPVYGDKATHKVEVILG